ncbi:MAG: T9SS type A sorting domain-containing protein [Elusimicrobiota bacterium]
MTDHKSVSKAVFLLRKAAIVLSAAAFVAGVGEILRVAASDRPRLIGPPFTIVASSFVAGGGDLQPAGSGRTLLSSIGGTGIPKMEGGDFKIGTGIIGGVGTSGINIDNAHAFPNPYIPSQGHAGITFSQLTQEATVLIYTLTGELVQELFKTDEATDRLAWFPVTNKRGNDIASGVYLIVIKSGDGQIKTGKLMVIK